MFLHIINNFLFIVFLKCKMKETKKQEVYSNQKGE